jgi:hypothetical protein
MKRLLFVALLFAASCVQSSDRPSADPSVVGPPRIQSDVVARHAEQFDKDIGARPAGSQEEFAAAAYITGHLQQAGYAVRLDAVPVADTVKSTNVIALAPSGNARYLVTVAYDTEPDSKAGYGNGLGAWLELARALKALDPDHDVSFVAVGAERTPINGGALGSRRLTQFLLDEDQHPTVINLGKVGTMSPPSVTVFGEDPGICGMKDCFEGVVRGTTAYERAGFRYIVVGGDPSAVGDALLEFLAGTRR